MINMCYQHIVHMKKYSRKVSNVEKFPLVTEILTEQDIGRQSSIGPRVQFKAQSRYMLLNA